MSDLTFAQTGGSTRTRRYSLIAFVLLLTILIDQVAKSMAIARLKGVEPQSYWGGLLHLTYAENPGAFLGLGHQLPDWLRESLLYGLIAILLTWLLGSVIRKNVGLLGSVAMSLLIGGGLSNLLDRLLRTEGRVIDFLIVVLGPVRTGVFNIADVAIMTGVSLLIGRSLKMPTDPQDK